MGSNFTIPDDYLESYRRLLPYMEASLHNDAHVLESILIYLKLGGEKLARIAIDAFNINQRMLDAEMRKKIRDQILLSAELEESDDQEDDESEDDDDEAENEADDL